MRTKLRESVLFGESTQRNDSIERAASDIRDALNNNPFLNGVMYAPGTQMTVGNNVISHRLGRTPQGWIVTRVTGAATNLYEVSRNERTITLNASAAGVCEIWFF